MQTEKRFNSLINSDKPVLVDFYTQWCNPCRKIPVLLEGAKRELKSSIRILKVDVDQNPGIATSFNVLNVPTLIVFKNGIPLWTKIDMPHNDELKEILLKHTDCQKS